MPSVAAIRCKYLGLAGRDCRWLAQIALSAWILFAGSAVPVASLGRLAPHTFMR